MSQLTVLETVYFQGYGLSFSHDYSGCMVAREQFHPTNGPIVEQGFLCSDQEFTIFIHSYKHNQRKVA